MRMQSERLFRLLALLRKRAGILMFSFVFFSCVPSYAQANLVDMTIFMFPDWGSEPIPSGWEQSFDTTDASHLASSYTWSMGDNTVLLHGKSVTHNFVNTTPYLLNYQVYVSGYNSLGGKVGHGYKNIVVAPVGYVYPSCNVTNIYQISIINWKTEKVMWFEIDANIEHVGAVSRVDYYVNNVLSGTLTTPGSFSSGNYGPFRLNKNIGIVTVEIRVTDKFGRVTSMTKNVDTTPYYN